MTGETDAEATRALSRVRELVNEHVPDRDDTSRYDPYDVNHSDLHTIKDALVDGETNYSPPNEEDEHAPECAHCGSSRTWWRSDGDVGCNDCAGITTTDEMRCEGCGSTGRELAAPCEFNEDGVHEIVDDVRVCLWCGEQGLPDELEEHDCPERDEVER